MITKKITSEDRKWALDNLKVAMKDLKKDSSDYDLSVLASIKAALLHLGMNTQDGVVSV